MRPPVRTGLAPPTAFVLRRARRISTSSSRGQFSQQIVRLKARGRGFEFEHVFRLRLRVQSPLARVKALACGRSVGISPLPFDAATSAGSCAGAAWDVSTGILLRSPRRSLPTSPPHESGPLLGKIHFVHGGLRQVLGSPLLAPRVPARAGTGSGSASTTGTENSDGAAGKAAAFPQTVGGALKPAAKLRKAVGGGRYRVR